MQFAFKSSFPPIVSLFVNGITRQTKSASGLFHTCAALYKGNARRTRVVAPGTDSGTSSKSDARRDSAKQMTASSNRNKWEASNRLSQQLVGKQPSTNVYFAADFETRRWDFPAALLALREAAQPDMYDCMQNPLKVKFTLNMRTKKKTKFVAMFEADTVLPHLLEFLPKRRVIALCKDESESNDCLQAGAFVAGGAELFSRIQHGAFHWEEFDGVVANSSWEPTISQLRNILKDRLPTHKNEWLGADTVRMVTSFSTGVHLNSVPLEGVPEIAYLDAVVGQLGSLSEFGHPDSTTDPQLTAPITVGSDNQLSSVLVITWPYHPIAGCFHALLCVENSVPDLQDILGQLSWDVDQLTENLQHYFDTIYGMSSSRVLGEAVVAVDVSCPPTGEIFPLDLSTFLSRVPKVVVTKQEEVGSASSEDQAAATREISPD